MEHPHFDLVTRFFGAFVAGDHETITSILDPGIRLEQSGHDALSGTYEGTDAVITHLLGDYGVEDWNMQILDMLASDTRVAILARSTGRLGDRPIASDAVMVARVADGRIVEIRVFTWDQQALAEAFPVAA